MFLRTLCILRERRAVFNIFIKSNSIRTGCNFCQLLPRVKTVVFNDNIKVRKCKFHTTERRDIPPGLALLIRPLTRIGAFLFGRYFRKWWAKKTPAEKEAFKKWLSARRQKIYGTLGILLAGLILFYVTHIEKDPLTGRSRLIILTKEQQKVFGKLIFDVHLALYEDSLVRVDHPVYVRLVRITNRLIKANHDIPSIADRRWTLSVVDSDSKNAFVLPGGNIFVFTGILKVIANDDQLASVLAHEISHVLLQHPIEQISRNVMMDILLAAPIAVIWAMFPDLLAVLLQVLGINLVNVFLSLPYSRIAEKEADDMGIVVAAKACFDVREIVVFWKMMKLLTDLNIEPKDIPWLSTHPSNEEREKQLSALMNEALAIRTKSGCPKLSPPDPVESFNARTMKQHKDHFKARGIL